MSVWDKKKLLREFRFLFLIFTKKNLLYRYAELYQLNTQQFHSGFEFMPYKQNVIWLSHASNHNQFIKKIVHYILGLQWLARP